MKKVILCLLTLLLTTMVEAQTPFTSVGSTWHYGVPDGLGRGTESYFTYIAVKDTVIAGFTYSKISNNQPGNLKDYYLSSSSDSIFYYFPSQAKRCLLFKTSARVNDTIEIDIPDVVTVTNVNTSKVIITVAGWKKNILDNQDSLKYFEFRTEPTLLFGHGKFYEKIISTGLEAGKGMIHLLDGPLIPEGNPYFRCFSSGAYQLRLYPGHACDYNNTALDEAPANGQKRIIYPNPAKDIIHAAVPAQDAFTYRIGRIDGTVMMEGMLTSAQVISVAGLHEGLYVFEVGNEGGGFTREKFYILR